MAGVTSRQPGGGAGDDGGSTDLGKISRDEVYDVLSNHRRRYALHYLKRNGARADLGTLSERVAAWENEIELEEVSSDQRKRVYSSLQRYHLPKMDDVDLVDYDRRSGEVALTDRAEDLDLYMEVVRDYDIPWSLYYVGLSMVGIVMLTANWLGVPPFAAIPSDGWTVFLLTSLLVSALTHAALTRRMRVGHEEAPPEVER